MLAMLLLVRKNLSTTNSAPALAAMVGTPGAYLELLTAGSEHLFLVGVLAQLERGWDLDLAAVGPLLPSWIKGGEGDQKI